MKTENQNESTASPTEQGEGADEAVLSARNEIIYKFIFCPCKYESAYATLSIHRTLKGAYRAMNKHLNDNYMKWYNERITYGKKYSRKTNFGSDKLWGIARAELFP